MCQKCVDGSIEAFFGPDRNSDRALIMRDRIREKHAENPEHFFQVLSIVLAAAFGRDPILTEFVHDKLPDFWRNLATPTPTGITIH
jgi:hypothetical protein